MRWVCLPPVPSYIIFSPVDKHRSIQFSFWGIWILRILDICNTGRQCKEVSHQFAYMECVLQTKYRSRMMSQPLVATTSRPGVFARLGRPSFVSVSCSIYSQDGIRGFFRGLGPTFLRAFPVNASAFFVFEAILRVLGAEKVRPFLNVFPLENDCPVQTRH
jgi:hypothetical protein